MTEGEDFIESLLKEAEQHEEQQTEAYFDLVLIQIKNISKQIEHNFEQAEKETTMIRNWTLNKNAVLNERIKILERKLEGFIREKKIKTIDLPNGTLKMHLKPSKVEVVDLEVFLKNARPELLSVTPETVKPDLNKIKAFIKHRPVPAGVKVYDSKEEFTYKIRKENDNGRQEAKDGIAVQSDGHLRIVS